MTHKLIKLNTTIKLVNQFVKVTFILINFKIR